MSAALRGLPSVDALLQAAGPLLARDPRAVVPDALRDALDDARSGVAAGATLPKPAALLGCAGERLAAIAAPSLRAVVNATGVVLHTNLGRAALADAAVAAIAHAATEPCNLE